jgi:HD-GYP domain-containing protein (c-di-GMP phosphodiesterase class II)
MVKARDAWCAGEGEAVFGRERDAGKRHEAWRRFEEAVTPPYELDRLLLAALEAVAILLPADGYHAYVAASPDDPTFRLRATRTRTGMPTVGPNYAGLVLGAPVEPAPLELERPDAPDGVRVDRHAAGVQITVLVGARVILAVLLPPRAVAPPHALADLSAWARWAGPTLTLAAYLEERTADTVRAHTSATAIERGLELALGTVSMVDLVCRRACEALTAADGYLVEWTGRDERPNMLWHLGRVDLLMATADPQEVWRVAAGAPSVVSAASLVRGAGDLPFNALVVIPVQLAEESGAIAVFARRPDAPPDSRTRVLLPHLTGTLTRALNQRRRQNALRRHYLQMLLGLSDLLDAADPYNVGHSRQVADVARAVAVQMGRPRDEVDAIYLAGRLHDVGMIGIDLNLPLTAGPLPETSRAVIQRHPEIGADLLEGLAPEIVPPVVRTAIRQHHERWDGGGYPEGLSGAQISVPGQILALAEQFVARVSRRAYRSGLPVNRALADMVKLRESVAAPEPVDALLTVYAEAGVQPAP